MASTSSLGKRKQTEIHFPFKLHARNRSRVLIDRFSLVGNWRGEIQNPNMVATSDVNRG